MNKQPLLSIIIPCYNNGEYLVEMLDCFLHQTSDAWEIIIVDDGSTDNTPELIKKYVLKESRINYVQRDRPPKGSVTCRNIGFDLAKGKYICHLDADDLVSKTFVENRVKFMEQHPELDYASFCAKAFHDADKLPTFESQVKTYGVKLHTNDLLEDFLTSRYSFSVWNNIYQRESIKDYRWDETVKIYTDFSFILPCILAGLKHSFSDIKQVDYYYRLFTKKKGSTNMCSNYVTDEKCDSTLYLFDKVLNSIKERPDYSKRRDQFFEFIVVNFERLMASKNVDQIKRYLQFIKKNFPQDNYERLNSIFKNCINIKNRRLFELKLYWNLHKIYPRRYKPALHIKFIKLFKI